MSNFIKIKVTLSTTEGEVLDSFFVIRDKDSLKPVQTERRLAYIVRAAIEYCAVVEDQ